MGDIVAAALPEPARKELYSYAYITAIAASAQCEIMVPKMDYDSLDAIVLPTRGVRLPLSLQLKATARECIENDEVVFDLPIKNYDDLRSPERLPSLLVVLHLPTEEHQWVTHQPDLLLLRNSAYYLNLLGRPEVQNEKTVRVRIPVAQRLTKESLLGLLQYVAVHKRLP